MGPSFLASLQAHVGVSIWTVVNYNKEEEEEVEEETFYSCVNWYDTLLYITRVFFTFYAEKYISNNLAVASLHIISCLFYPPLVYGTNKTSV